MRFLVGLFLSAFLAVACHNCYAQITTSAIQGKVLTEDRAPANGATIILLKYQDSSVVNSAVADKEGLFKFGRIQQGRYLLLITVIGYEKFYRGPFDVFQGKTFNTPEILLKVSSRRLSLVSVIGAKPPVEVQPGKTILNVKNSVMYAGNSLYDILRQSPGVRVDNNIISIIGRQNALITIDGKTTALTSDDLINYLKSMQASAIDRIELVFGGSAKSDASAGGIINIILNKGTAVGANGAVNVMAGIGRYYKGGAGINFNDRSNKFNIFGSYNYSEDKTFHSTITDRLINFNNLSSNYHVDYNGIQVSHNHNFNFGTDYFLSLNHTIGFLVGGSVIDNNYNKNDNLKIYNQSVLDSTIISSSSLNRHFTRMNYNLNYSGKLDNTGTTISANINYNTIDRGSNEYIINDFFDISGNSYRNPFLLQNLSPSSIRMWISQVDFSDPLSKTSKLEAGVRNTNVTSNNDLIFGPLVNGTYTSDAAFTNHFVYTENVNVAYVNYQNKFEKVNVIAGLRVEQTIAKGNSVTASQIVNRNYTDLFPNLLLTYKQDDKRQFSLSYKRGITRPKYEDLNPFLIYTDLYDYREGNPNLKPEYLNSLELSYRYKAFVTTLYASIVSNADDFYDYQQNDSTKKSISTYVNFGKIYNYGLKFFAPVVLTSWWNANFSTDVVYARYVAYPNNGNLNKGTQDIFFDTQQYFIINNTITATISGHYESPNFYGISQYKAVYNINAGIGKQLFNNRGSLVLNATDIFNTLQDRAHTNYQNLNMSIINKRESQVIRLTFTYRFGKTSLKTIAGHTTLNKEEQTRIGAGTEN